jgi:hypothetical protein
VQRGLKVQPGLMVMMVLLVPLVLKEQPDQLEQPVPQPL